MAKRKQQHAEHENAERWLLTYADMITLLMAFFIMLYSMSQLDIRKFAAVAGSVRAELGGTGVLEGAQGVGSGSGSGIDLGMNGLAPSLGTDVSAQLRRAVEAEMKAASASQVQVIQDGSTVRVRMPAGSLYFEKGSASLTPQARRVLLALAHTLRKQPCGVRVEGHTCNLPIHTVEFPSNWELSAARASNTALFLVREGGLPSDHCSFMGLADRKPLVPNVSEINRRRNRRVELILQPLAADPPADKAARPTAAKPEPQPSALPPAIDITTSSTEGTTEVAP
ncbi:MAG: flagellar motor protein MotB [Armatimonadia bacterium]